MESVKPVVGVVSIEDPESHEWLTGLLSSLPEVKEVLPIILSGGVSQDVKDRLSLCHFLVLYDPKRDGDEDDGRKSSTNADLEYISQLHDRKTILVIARELEDMSPEQKIQELRRKDSFKTWTQELILFTGENNKTLISENPNVGSRAESQESEDRSSEQKQDTDKTWTPEEGDVITEPTAEGQIQEDREAGEENPTAIKDGITSKSRLGQTETSRRNIIQEDVESFPEETSKKNFFQKYGYWLTIPLILVIMVIITGLGAAEVANRGSNENVTSTPDSSSQYPEYSASTVGTETSTVPQIYTTYNTTTVGHTSTSLHTSSSRPEGSSNYPEYNTITVGINKTETSTVPQIHTTHNTTTEGDSTTTLYTSTSGLEGSGDYPVYNTTTVGINQTEMTTSPQQYPNQNTTVEEQSISTSTSEPQFSTSNLTSSTSLPGITTEGPNPNATTLVAIHTEANTFDPENTTPNVNIKSSTRAGHEVTTASIQNFTSLYTSTSLPEGSTPHIEYNTTTIGINWTETSMTETLTVPQVNTTYNTITEGSSKTTPHTVTSLPEVSSVYPEYSTTTVRINRTELNTSPQQNATHNTTIEEHSTASSYTSTSDLQGSTSNLTSPTSLPGITTEGPDLNASTLVTIHTEANTFDPENTTPNVNIQSTTTAGLEVTTASMENATSLYPPTSLLEGSTPHTQFNTTTTGINSTETSTVPQIHTTHNTTTEGDYTTTLNAPTSGLEASSDYPEYSTTTVGMNRTEMNTSPQQDATHNTTIEEHSTASLYTSTSDLQGSTSNLTSTTSLPGITTESPDLNVTTLVTIHTEANTFDPEITTPNVNIQSSTKAGLEVTTASMENATSLYPPTSLLEGSTPHTQYNTTTIGINRTEMNTSPQQNATHNTTIEEHSTASPYTSTSDPQVSTSNLTSPSMLPGITSVDSNINTTTMEAVHTEDNTLVPGNTTPDMNIQSSTTAGLEISTPSMKNSTSLYPPTSLPERSSHYPEYNTTTVGITKTEMTTSPQQYITHITATEESSTLTSDPGRSTSNLTSPTSVPEITTEGSALTTTIPVTIHTEDNTFDPENATAGEYITGGVEVTTTGLENATSLYPPTSLLEDSTPYTEYNTTTVGINWTETSMTETLTVSQIHTTNYTITEGNSTTTPYTPTSLPEDSSDYPEYNTTTVGIIT